MLRVVYTLIFIVALPVIFYRLWVKDKKVPGYRVRWPERFGISTAPPPGAPVVWVHAVSVGEVVAATPLIKRLLQCERIRLLVTTMTPTGSTRVLDTFGDQVMHVYAPYDLPWTVAAFLRRTHPTLAIIMETELWPNMLHECAKLNLPVILANGRMSERSANGYLRFPRTTKKLLNSLDYVAAQNPRDGERFLRMGLQPDRLVQTGNIKFDLQVADELVTQCRELKTLYGENRHILVAASTHEGEEKVILQAFKALLKTHPHTLLILVPRHPERFEHVAELCQEQFHCVRRSSAQSPTEHTQVVIGDTMGEVMMFYGVADVAIVGGSFIERGGHNMIEPAYWGVPILCGPHTFNFSDVSRRLLACQGMETVSNAQELTQALTLWLNDENRRTEVGQNARAFAEQNRGAIDRLMTLITRYIEC